MHSVYLKFFAYELQKQGNLLLYEWMIREAQKLHIPGASVFRAIAGYGRNFHLHEEHFYELASNVPIEIVFVATDEQADQLINEVKKNNLDLFYIKIPAISGSSSQKNVEL